MAKKSIIFPSGNRSCSQVGVQQKKTPIPSLQRKYPISPSVNLNSIYEFTVLYGCKYNGRTVRQLGTRFNQHMPKCLSSPWVGTNRMCYYMLFTGGRSASLLISKEFTHLNWGIIHDSLRLSQFEFLVLFSVFKTNSGEYSTSIFMIYPYD